MFSPFCLFSHSISFSIVSGPRRRVCAASVSLLYNLLDFLMTSRSRLIIQRVNHVSFFFSFFSHLFKTLRTKNQLMFHLFYFPL